MVDKKKMSMEEIARLFGRSSRTVWREITYHNRMVKELGYCPRCRRVHGRWQSVEV